MNSRLRRALTVLSAAVLTVSGTVVLSPPASAAGNTIFVASDGTDFAGCGAEHSACQHIQYALDNIVTGGETVSVLAGTYSEPVTISTPVILQGSDATIDGSVTVGQAAGAVAVTGFTIESDTATPLISVQDTDPDAAVSITDNIINGTATAAQTGIAAGPTAALTVTGDSFDMQSTSGGAAIDLSAPDESDALAVTLGGNSGTVAAPTRTIVESGDGAITVTATDTPNTIAPAGASLSVPLPAKIFTDHPASPFTGTADNGGVELPAARYSIHITGMSGLLASQLTLEYEVDTDSDTVPDTWLSVPLSGAATAGNAITGTFGPAIGFDFPPGQNETPFRVSATSDAPVGSLDVVTTLDEVGDQSGNPAINTVAMTESTVVIADNHTPVATPQSVDVPFNTAKAIMLAGTDADSDPLTFAIADGPAHGQLTGTAPSVTYTPNAGYTGTDSFTFTVSDGVDTSAPATVSLNVTNQAPVAQAQSLRVPFNATSFLITLTAHDPESDPTTFAVTQPAHGSVVQDPLGSASVTYAPDTGYSGPDPFTFTASDNHGNTSAAATISLSVDAVPVPTSRAVNVPVNSHNVAITLSATDSDDTSSSLTYAVAAGPHHGTLGGTAPNLTYTPASGYAGPDSFTFTADDHHGGVATGTVSITVDTNPIATSRTVTIQKNAKNVPISITASDADAGDHLSYTLTTRPGHGSLAGTAPNYTYTPMAGYAGSDSLSFRVNDSHGGSASGAISIIVNTSPLAAGASLTVPLNASKVAITLRATDADGDSIRYAIATRPKHGTLAGSAPRLNYTPTKGYAGSDSFTFSANDSHGGSSTATVTLRVAKAAAKVVSVSFSPKRPTSAHAPKATVTVSSVGTVTGGVVTITYGANKRTAKVSRGKAIVTLTRMTGGTHRLTITFGGTSTTTKVAKTLSLTVSKVATSMSVKISPSQLTTTSNGKAIVTIAAPGAHINGKKVTIKEGSRVIASGTLARRVATIALPRFGLGQHNLTVSYPGTTTAAAVTKTVILRVALG